MKGDKTEKRDEEVRAEKGVELREAGLELAEIDLPENSVWAVFIRRLRECPDPETFELTPETTEELESLAEKMFIDKPIVDVPKEEIEFLKMYFKNKYLRRYQRLIRYFKEHSDFPDKEKYITALMNPELDATIVTRDGSRGVDEYEYYGVDVVDSIRKQIAQGKSVVKVLDIGSASARMLAELKLLPEFAGKIEVYALSPSPEPHYRVDKYYQLCGEYLPEEFKNRFDVIVSNMALIYSYFPDHAIRSASQALAEDGEAQLNIPCYRSPDPYDEEEKMREFAEINGIDLKKNTRNERIARAYDDVEKTATVMEKDGVYCIQK